MYGIRSAEHFGVNKNEMENVVNAWNQEVQIIVGVRNHEVPERCWCTEP